MCLRPFSCSLTSLELMTERQVIAWSSSRSKAQLQAPRAFPSAFLWHSSNALCITGTEPDWQQASKTHYTLPSCVSSSLIFPSIPLVTRTGALSFLVLKCLPCSRRCRPQPRAWQLSLGQRHCGEGVDLGGSKREQRNVPESSTFNFHCPSVQLRKRKAVTNTESDRLQTVTSENPDLSHGGEGCCAAVPSNSSYKAY